MLEQAKQILEGWTNTIIKKDNVEEVARVRMMICNNCVYQSENAKKVSNYTSIRPDIHCTECGCPLISKTRSLATSCPKEKWKAIE